jgi:hypothetical protein
MGAVRPLRNIAKNKISEKNEKVAVTSWYQKLHYNPQEPNRK